MGEGERIAKLEVQVKKHDEQIEKLNDVYIALTKVTDKVQTIENDVSEIKTDMKEIKERPSKKWDKLVDYIFYFILALILGYICHQLGIKS